MAETTDDTHHVPREGSGYQHTRRMAEVRHRLQEGAHS
jgi:hypothetical protein